jgi:hypothetical protein
MDILLKTYHRVSDEDKKTIYEKGTFFFDTNVLLNLFRHKRKSREDWLKTL